MANKHDREEMKCTHSTQTVGQFVCCASDVLCKSTRLVSSVVGSVGGINKKVKAPSERK